jgi:hypothetical protein
MEGRHPPRYTLAGSRNSSVQGRRSGKSPSNSETGPPYESPDIWVEDAQGNKTVAQKGTVNTLVAQVRNIGDQHAGSVKVRLLYAPYGMGYAHKDFKQIDEKTVSLNAGQTQQVKVSWNLTNLNETNGGLWPYNIDKFDHFCARVEIDGGDDDVNSCNNVAQRNFVKVGTAKPAEVETTVLVANPLQDAQAAVKIDLRDTFSRGWQAWVDNLPPRGELRLRPGEKRLLRIHVSVPDAPLIQAPVNGSLQASLRGQRRSQIVGRLSESEYSQATGEFQGKLSGTLRTTAQRSGKFKGVIRGRILDETTGKFDAAIHGTVVNERGRFEVTADIGGQLTPERTVSIGASVKGSSVGGVDFSVEPGAARP